MRDQHQKRPEETKQFEKATDRKTDVSSLRQRPESAMSAVPVKKFQETGQMDLALRLSTGFENGDLVL